MENSNQSAKFKKQRKFLLVLPLLTLPFITLMFWALGGGKGNAAAVNNNSLGINLKLPDAKLKDDKQLDKLSFYHQAALDSAKAKAAEKLDPYWHRFTPDSNESVNNNYAFEIDANKTRVYNKLDELKKILGHSEQRTEYQEENKENDYNVKSYSSKKEIERLQEAMQQVQESPAEDPEITQLNTMLDRIQAIQNPGKENYTPRQKPGKNFTVRKKNAKANVSLLQPADVLIQALDTFIQTENHNAFYGISNDDKSDDAANNNAIECFIPETQTLVAGATIKMAISSDITINDMNLPSGTLVYGTASIANERLKVAVSSIRYENSILPVSLNVYDMDGQEGIFIPGSISRTVAKESTGKAISGIDATMIDPSIGAQAASAGIEAAKTLIGKKTKLIKVMVKSGYKVLLKDTNEK